MGKIKVLPQEVISKIAAGEVVERPASVVKELLENSLDAKSTRIAIDLREGGKSLIRVRDNGVGMDEADARLALAPHATSKISTVEEISRIQSFGFRGEALASICAVSHLRLTTRAQGSDCGAQVEAQGSKILSIRSVGAPEGTFIDVRNLFFNLPARRKQLKSTVSETRQVIRVAEKIALLNPEASFRLQQENKVLLDVPAVPTLKERIKSLHGKEIFNSLLELDFRERFLKITGFISKPDLTYRQSNQIYMFVNRRPINSTLIVHAIREGYQGFLMKDRWPVVFLSIEIEPSLVDVNIHPTKREVRFLNEQGIYAILVKLIKDRLHTSRIIPAVSGEEELPRKEEIKKAIAQYLTNRKPRPSGVDLFQPSKFIPPKPSPIPSGVLSGIVPLAQIDNTYIISQDEDGLLVIDQHAASERINYERFKQSLQGQKLETQQLLLPITLELSPAKAALLKEQIVQLVKLGFEIEEFGRNTFIVKAVPALVSRRGDKNVISRTIDELGEVNFKKSPNELLEELCKLLACHSAIRAGDKLQPREMERLISQLQHTDLAYTCPHGRPTMIKITRAELETRFKRK